MSATSSVSSLSMDSTSSGQNKTSSNTYQSSHNHNLSSTNIASSLVSHGYNTSMPNNSNSSNPSHTYQTPNNSKAMQTTSPVYSVPTSLNNSSYSNNANSNNSGSHYSQATQHPLPPHQQNSPHKNPSPDFYIIRVTYETDNIELDGIVLYKSIMLGNNERTPQVIKNSMLKLGLEGDPEKYTLAQVLPDKELVMPPNANVYYAVNTAYNLNFILRPKRNSEV